MFIVFYYLFKSHMKTELGYMNDIVKDTNNTHFSYETSLDYYLDNVPPGTLKGIVKYNGENIGSVYFYKWDNPKGLVIANGLEVNKNHRGKGVAKYLIHQCCRKIINAQGFGIFSSSLDLDIKKIHQLYWYKDTIGCSKSKSKSIVEIKIINVDEIDFTHYPKHNWLHVNRLQLDRYLRYIVSSGLTILKYKDIILGVQNVKDKEGHMVCHVKWYWGSDIDKLRYSIMVIMNVNYIALPSIQCPVNIWDKSITYIYAKPHQLVIPDFTERDILGWYLDR